MAVLNYAEKNRINKLISGFKDEIVTISIHECSMLTNSVNVICNCRYGYFKPIDLVGKNTWYSGMELNKKYTLEELGL